MIYRLWGIKLKQTNIFISQVEKIIKAAEVYSKVGRLFIKEEKKQVVDCGGPKQADGEQCEALVMAVGVMREEGITVDEVMDLVIESNEDRDGAQSEDHHCHSYPL